MIIIRSGEKEDSMRHATTTGRMRWQLKSASRPLITTMVYLWFWVSLNAQLGVLLQAAAMMTDGYAREPVDHRRP
jgi:hypothetical protein